MDRRRFLALIPATTVAGCSNSSDGTVSSGAPTTTRETSPTTSPTPRAEIEDVSTTTMTSSEANEPLTIQGVAKLTDHRWPAEYDHRGYTSGVVGRVENIDDKRLAEIYVEANFLDEDGRIIGERWDSVSFIRPGEFYDIHLPYDGDAPSRRVARYELVLSAAYDTISPLNDGQVDLSEHQWGTIDDTTSGVSGTGTNATEKRLRSVVVSVNFYDGDYLLYERKDKVTRVDPGQSFEWSVGYYRDDPPSGAVEDYTVISQVNVF